MEIGLPFYMNDSYVTIARRVKEKLAKEDTEFWVAFDGKTGSGKSIRAQQFGWLVDPTLADEDAINRICFDKKEFITAVVKHAKKGQVVIADESVSIFFKRSSMTKEARVIAELINQIRQKNLCIILCIPDICDLDKIAVEKLSMYVHISERRKPVGKDFETVKGEMSAWVNMHDEKRVQQVVNTLKAKKNGKSGEVNLKAMIHSSGEKATLQPWSPVENKNYRKKKESVLDKYINGEAQEKPLGVLDQKRIYQRDKVIWFLMEKYSVDPQELMNLIDVDQATIRDAYERINKEKLGKA